MDYISVTEFAKRFGVAERTVRNYCAQGKIDGAVLVGKTWSLPVNARLPERRARGHKPMPLLLAHKEQKDAGLKGAYIIARRLTLHIIQTILRAAVLLTNRHASFLRLTLLV